MSVMNAKTNGWHKDGWRIKTISSLIVGFFGFMGLWVINDFAGGMNQVIENTYGQNPIAVTNGWFTFSYAQIFHIGLYASMFSILILSVMCLWFVRCHHDAKDD